MAQPSFDLIQSPNEQLPPPLHAARQSDQAQAKVLVLSDQWSGSTRLLDLRQRGLEVTVAFGIDEAIITIAEHAPDVLIVQAADDADALRLVADLGPRPFTIMIYGQNNHPGARLLALERGADDYFSHEVGLGELVFRTRALKAKACLLRQACLMEQGAVRDWRGWRLDLARHTFSSADGRCVSLPPVSFRLLSALWSRQGRVVGFSDLAQSGGTMGNSLRRPQTLNVEVYRLRRILAAVWDTVFVENIRGIGYRLAIGGAAERRTPSA